MNFCIDAFAVRRVYTASAILPEMMERIEMAKATSSKQLTPEDVLWNAIDEMEMAFAEVTDARDSFSYAAEKLRVAWGRAEEARKVTSAS